MSNACGHYVSQADFEANCPICQNECISRLTAELDDAISANHSVSVCADHTSEIITFDGCVICEIEHLTAKVERLEKEVALQDSMLQGEGHHITTEQINLAWKLANNKQRPVARRVFAELVLNKLGIHRCEGCDTEAKKRKWQMLRQECPDCALFGSKGWVVMWTQEEIDEAKSYAKKVMEELDHE